MFIIKDTDISYRFLKTYHSVHSFPRDFCSYYRKVIKTIIALFFIGYSVAWTPFTIFTLLHEKTFILTSIPFVISVILGFIVCLLAIGVGTAFILRFVIDLIVDLIYRFIEYRDRKADYTDKPVKRSIIMTWIRAKKQKMCPYIDFVKTSK